MLRFYQKTGPTKEEWEGLPDYMQSTYVLKLGNKLVSGFGEPFAAILSLGQAAKDTAEGDKDALFDEFILKTAPYVRMPLELLADKDFFFDEDLNKLNSGKEFTQILRWLQKDDLPTVFRAGLTFIQETLNLKEEGERREVTMNPTTRWILRNLPSSRYASSLAQLERMSDKEQGTMKWGIRWLTGFYTVEPNMRMRSSQEAREVRVWMNNRLDELSLGKRMDVKFFLDRTGDEAEKDIYDIMNEALKDGVTPSQVKDIRKRLNAAFELINEAKLKASRTPPEDIFEDQ